MKFTNFRGHRRDQSLAELLPGFGWHLLTDDLLRGPNSSLQTAALKAMRNYVVGPFTEEWIFRSCMCPLLVSEGLSVSGTVFLAPLFFSLAHMHHMWRTDKARPSRNQVLFQMVYTAIFGWYAAYLFLRTGNIVAPFVAHSICNVMQVPPFNEVPSRSDKNVCIALYVGGLAFFFATMQLVSDPLRYGSPWYLL